jgi:hypothetical protein
MQPVGRIFDDPLLLQAAYQSSVDRDTIIGVSP